MAYERIDIVVTERGSRTVKRDISSIGTVATAASGAVKLLAKSLALLGGVVALHGAVQTIASFGQAMSTVKAITKATSEEFVKLTAKAAKLGATTRFTATQAGQGMLFLARAGFDADQVLAAIPGTLNLAQAGALDLGRAADIASNILKAFRLEIEETSRVVDVLALTANSSNTNVEQLGDAMKFVAPVAAGVGISLETTAAAVASLSDAGLQASIAGTGLRRILAELESPAVKTAGILEKLKLTTDDVRVSQVGLIEALRRLRDAGASTGHALEIFGDRGGPAFEVLSNAIPQIRQFEAEFKKAAGTAERIAEIMDDNLNGALLRVRSAAEAVSLAIGALGANTALTNFLDATAFLIRAVANHVRLLAIAFTGLIVVLAPALLATVATRFLGISAAAITVRSTLAGIVGVLGGLVSGFARTLLAPIRWLGIIAAKILGIKTAAVTLTAGLSKAVLMARLLGKAFAWGLIIEGIFMVVGALYKLIKTVRQTEMTWRDAAVVGIERFVNTIVGGLYALGRIIAGITPVLIDPLIAGFSEVGNQIVDLLLGKISGTDAVAAVANRVSKVFTESLEKTMKDVEDLWNTRYLKLATKLQLTFFGESSKQPRGSDLPYIPPKLKVWDSVVEETDLPTGAGFSSDKQRTAFERLRDSLDTVGAAKRRLVEGQELINMARREGLLFLKETTQLEAALRETLKSSLDPLYKTKKALQDVQDLRARGIKERRVESEVQQIVTDMRLRGTTLSDKETQALRNMFITRDRTLKQFDREESIYRSLQDPVKEYERGLRALNAVLEKYPELAAQAGKVTRSLRTEFLDTQTSIDAGIKRGLLDVSNPFEQTRKAAESVRQAYRSLQDPVKEYERGLRALNAVLEKYPELAAQAGKVTRSLHTEFLDTQTSIDAGIKRGLLDVSNPFEQTRKAAESVRQAYRSLQDPVKEYERGLRALNAVLEKYPELAAQAGKVTRSLRMELLDTQASIDAGIERGLLDVSNPFEQTRKAAESVRQAYRSLQDPVKEYERGLRALNAVLEKYPELAAQAGKVTRSLRTEFLDTQTSIDAGIKRGLLDVSNPFEQTRKAAESVRQAYRSLQDPVKEYELRLKALNAVLEKYPELAAQAGKVTRSLHMEFLSTQTSLSAGMERGLLDFSKNMMDGAKQMEQAIVNTFGNMEQALLDFVSTGKFSFKNMVDAMVADLARLLIRTQILGPFAAFFSGLGFKDGGLAMASGGLARGPGTSRSDSIPAYLSNGEFVVNQRATRDYLPQLDRINRGQAPNSGGGGTNVYVVDQRTTQDSEPAQIEHGTGGDGKEFIRVTIRDGVRESISSGEIDRPMFHRYGLRPVLS